MSEGYRHTEMELFALIAESDEEAFNRLYLLLLPECTAYTFKILKSEEAVKEVLQESLVRFWLSRDKLADIENPRGWFFTIIANECFRYLRRHGLRQRMLEQLDTQGRTAGKEASHQTEWDISFQETQRIIAQTVAALSPRQRTIYKMSREEGLTLPEIAQALDLSRDYVKKTLMLALQIIRRRLTEAGRFIIFFLFLLR